ncbi:MAG: right-handed parallel beta-helix repeat-containing protein [Verrucomicrobiota bacterium]
MKPVFLILVFAAAMTASTHAQVTVYVDQSATGNADGTTWASAFTHLQDALSVVAPEQDILVAAGTYHPDEGTGQTAGSRASTFSLVSEVGIFGGFPSGGGAFSQRDPETHPTILSGDLARDDGPAFNNRSDNALHVVTAIGVDSNASLDGFIISGGNADGTTTEGRGGGLRCERGSPSFAHCLFSDNQAVSGGGVSTTLSSSNFLHCGFSGNTDSSSGGAVWNSDSSPIITNCRFSANEAADGGSISNIFASPIIINCAFIGNAASGEGGAVRNISASPEFINCTFQGNHADTSGGAMASANSSPVFRNSILWNNAEAGITTTKGASLVSTAGTSQFFASSLVHNWAHTALNDGNFINGNLDGIDPGNDPLFIAEADPLAAPSAGGNLRLRFNSPVIDVGNNAANSEPTDLDGKPRIRNNVIDLGAFEALTDFASLWLTDLDHDGSPFGTEIALGTNPDATDRNDPRNPSCPVINSNGDAIITFGRGQDAPVGTNWILSRSTTLKPGSFEEIYRFDGATGTPGQDIQAVVDANSFQIEDQNPPAPRAYYRFEAVYAPTAF